MKHRAPNTDLVDSSRRTFLRQGTALGCLIGAYPLISTCKTMKSLNIRQVSANFEREALIKPFGFKGAAMKEVWQTAVWAQSDSGITKIGLGTQNVLWSDSRVFAAHSENGGNALMFAMTEYAAQRAKAIPFETPIELLDALLEEVWEYGKEITGQKDLRKTFALNALVPVDNAAWLLYAAENKLEQFDRMIPERYRTGLSHRHSKVAAIPALGYGTSMEEIKQLADQGFFIMKIKIGAPGDPETMLKKDQEFLKQIHETIGAYETPHTSDGKIPYYFDANGRYPNKAHLQRFLDYADKIGALEQIALVEEPFGEKNHENVADMGVVIAADESAHTDEDAKRRIDEGYSSIALKAVAKTLSMTLKIIEEAEKAQVPCFCADLTVNPVLIEWNKAVAARLSPFPGLDFGLQETNGFQNYQNWENMVAYHPRKDAPWVSPQQGVYPTGKVFFDESGGIFESSQHFERMFE